jgi:hypothetical protein
MPAIASLEDLRTAPKRKLLSPQSFLLSTDEGWLAKEISDSVDLTPRAFNLHSSFRNVFASHPL